MNQGNTIPTKDAFVFRVACPSCGAPVVLSSATSLMAVCSYCTATLIRQDDQLIDSGEKSAILADYSLIQIGTSGVFQKQAFSVIGLWQIVYQQGFWNEWHILFANGQTGWLAEFNGLCTITTATNEVVEGIIFDKISSGFTRYRGFLAADVRTISSISCKALGELPFLSHQRNQTTLRLVDFRRKNQFFTLDFDSDDTATLYRGQVVLMSGLNLKNTRSNQQIRESSGNLRGTPQSFSCPHCGYSLKWYPGIAEIVYCTACISEIHLSSSKIALTQAHSKKVNQQRETTLKLGTVLPLLNKKWTVIGIIKYKEFEFARAPSKQNVQQVLKQSKHGHSSAYWYEYLLYQPALPFLFLTESVCDDEVEWQLCYTKNYWPNFDSEHNITTEKGKKIKPAVSYIGKVDFAIGAFNWQVGKGDQIFCHNYERYFDHETDGTALSVEFSGQEISFSASRYLQQNELKACQIENSTHIHHKDTYSIIFFAFVIINFLLMFFYEDEAPEFIILLFFEGMIFMVLGNLFLWKGFPGGFETDDDD